MNVAADVRSAQRYAAGTSSSVSATANNSWAMLKKAFWHIVSIPVRSSATTGRGVLLAGAVVRHSIVDAITLRLPFGAAAIEAWALFKVTALPTVLMAIPFGAVVSVQASGLVNQIGATSLLGAAGGVGVIRQGAPFTAGLIISGAAGSAIAADLGARAIREELDALRVMGIDPVRHLVVPRFWALVFIAPILSAIVIAGGVLAAFSLAVMLSGVTSGSFWMSFGSFAKPVDLYFAVGKTVLFGAVVAIIASLRGMEARGGARGVADAVNSTVVLSVVCIMVANLAITQLQTMFYPAEIS